jgi:hypothetical protein
MGWREEYVGMREVLGERRLDWRRDRMWKSISLKAQSPNVSMAQLVRHARSTGGAKIVTVDGSITARR